MRWCVCNGYLASESREGVIYRITLWLAVEKKPSSNNVLFAIHIFVLMSKKLKAVKYMTPSNSRLSISASGAIFSSLVLVSVYYSPVLSPTLLPNS